MNRTVLATILITLGLLSGACSNDGRPKISEWKPEWEETRDLVPDAATIEEEGSEVCGTLLGEVRERRERLTPAPTEMADEAFTEWVERTEALGLDCEDGTEDLEDRLAEIETVANRVDAALGGR